MRWAWPEFRAAWKAGDGLVFTLAATFCAMTPMLFWSTAEVERAVIKQGGRLVGEYRLGPGLQRSIAVAGPLGITQLELDGRRARVASDPGPRQLCVQQGWLTRAGALALCAPNQVTLQLLGGQRAYDSLHY